MRRFVIWVDGAETRIEMSDDATDKECEDECQDALDALLGTVIDSGWNEIDAEGNECAVGDARPK